jgi:hypothetical protein
LSVSSPFNLQFDPLLALRPSRFFYFHQPPDLVIGDKLDVKFLSSTLWPFQTFHLDRDLHCLFN